jgi:3-mercaptopyruvate sulfurtransferase SseA
VGHVGHTHIDGGFAAWKAQAAPIQTLAEHHEAAKAAKAKAATPAAQG